MDEEWGLEPLSEKDHWIIAGKPILLMDGISIKNGLVSKIERQSHFALNPMLGTYGGYMKKPLDEAINQLKEYIEKGKAFGEDMSKAEEILKKAISSQKSFNEERLRLTLWQPLLGRQTSVIKDGIVYDPADPEQRPYTLDEAIDSLKEYITAAKNIGNDTSDKEEALKKGGKTFENFKDDLYAAYMIDIKNNQIPLSQTPLLLEKHFLRNGHVIVLPDFYRNRYSVLPKGQPVDLAIKDLGNLIRQMDQEEPIKKEFRRFYLTQRDIRKIMVRSKMACQQELQEKHKALLAVRSQIDKVAQK